MTKAELIEKIARSRKLSPDVTKKCIQQIIELTFAELGQYFLCAHITKTQTPRFTFPGFGTFTKKHRKARKGIHPRTLQSMQITAQTTIDFKPCSDLRKMLNTGNPKVSPVQIATSIENSELNLANAATENDKIGVIKIEEFPLFAKHEFGTNEEKLPNAPLQRIRIAPRKAYQAK